MPILDEFLRRAQANSSSFRNAVTAAEQKGLISSANSYSQKTAQQNLQYSPAPTKSFTFDQNSSSSQVLAGLYQMQMFDKAKADELMGNFMQLQSSPSSRWYNPYTKATNLAIGELEAIGLDMSGGVNDAFFQNYSFLKDYYRTSSASGGALAPTKKSSAEEKAAYWYNQLLKDEENTKKAETEWAALQEEISYWTNRSDRNYSDDEILGKINWNNYKTLQKMDEAKATGNPMMLNRAIGYDRDSLKGVIWSTRNGSTGNVLSDAAMAELGKGKGWHENANVRGKLDVTNKETYSPYSVGSTLDDAALYFGVNDFSSDWCEKNRHLLASDNDTDRKMWQKVYEAEQNTKKAEAELAELMETIDNLKYDDANPEVLVELVKGDLEKWPTLNKMDESRESAKLMDTTRAVNYRWEDVEAEIRRRAEYQRQNSAVTLKKAYKRLNGATNINEHEPADLANKNSKISDAYTIIYNDATDAEKKVFKHAGSSGFWDQVWALRDIVQKGQALPQTIVDAEKKQASDYAAQHLFDSRKTIDDYESAQQQKNDAQQVIDSILEGMPANVGAAANPRFMGVLAAAGVSERPMWSNTSLRPDTAVNVTPPEEDSDEGKALLMWMAQNRDRVQEINQQADWDDDKAWAMAWQEYQQEQMPDPQEIYIESLDPETRAQYYAAQKALEEADATIEKLQGSYEEAQGHMEQIGNRQDIAARMGALGGADMGEDQIAAMNQLYEIGKEYKPTVYSTETIFDALPEKERIPAAKKAVEEYTAELQRIDEDMKALDGVQFSESSNDIFKNVQREQERLQRELTAAQDFLLRGKDDFDTTADAEIQKVKDATTANWLGLRVKGEYNWFDAIMADPSLIAKHAPDEVYIPHMTEEERKTYFYIRATEGKKAASDYYWRLADNTYGVLTNRIAQSDAAEQAEFAKEHPIAANVSAILLSPVKAAGGIYGFATLLTGGDVNPNSPWRAVSNYSATVKGTTQQQINEYFGDNTKAADVATFVYNALSSVGESTMNTLSFGALVPGGGNALTKVLSEFLGATPMALGAAGDTISKAVADGATPEQALSIGAVTMLAEAGTEAITLGNMKEAFTKGISGVTTAKGFKGFMIDLAKDMGEEATGEMINEVVEYLADDKIMGELGERQTRINELIGQGMSPDDAEAKANGEFIGRVLETGLSAMLSAGITTGGSKIVGAISNNAKTARISRNNMAILEESMQADTASQTEAVAATLATDGNVDASTAAAVEMMDALGGEKSINAMKHIEAIAASNRMNLEEVHNAVRTAATGKGRSFTALRDIAEHGATPQKVQNLVSSAEIDIANAEVQERMQQTEADIRAAGMVREQAANGAFDSVYASQQEAQKAKAKQRVAEKELERQQKKAEQLGDAFMTMQDQYMQDPTNIKAEGAMIQAMNDLDGQNEVVHEYEQSLQNQQEATAMAERKHERETEKALAIAREQAEADVASEDAERELRERRRGYINDHLSGLSQSAREFVERLAAENGIDLDGSKEGLEFARAARDYYLNGRLGTEFDAKEHEKNSTLGEQIRKYAKQEKANETLEKATEKSTDEIKEKYGIDKALEKDIKEEAERNGLQFDEDDPNWKKFLYLANLWYRNGFLGEAIPGNLQFASLADQYIEALNGIRELGAEDRLANQALDEQANTQYNNGEVNENAVQPGSVDQGEGLDAGQLPAEPGRDDGRGDNVYDGSRSGRETGSGGAESGTGSDGQGDGGGQTGLRILSPETHANMEKNGVTDLPLKGETDRQRFSSALAEGRASNENGVYVDNQSVEDLERKGAIMILSEDGLAGAAIGTKGNEEGNIFGVFKHKDSTANHASTALMIQAIAEGGNKLDCYAGKKGADGLVHPARGLARMYAQTGFVPVARVTFVDGINQEWDAEKLGRPPVIFWMHNGDSADVVAQKLGLSEQEGGYHVYTDDELMSLPVFDDVTDADGNTQYGYDRAWEYRDNMLAEAQAKQAAVQEADGDNDLTRGGGGTTTGNIKYMRAGSTQQQQQGASSVHATVSPYQSAINLADKLGIGHSIGTKKMNNLPRSVRGYYQQQAQNLAVRSSDAGNYQVTMHEIFHHLGDKYGMTGTPEMINNLPALFADAYSPAELADEALAEFGWRWIMGDDVARGFAGDDFVDEFESNLRKNGDYSALAQARGEVQAFLNTPLSDRLHAVVRNKSDVGKNNGGIRKFFSSMLDDSSAAETLNHKIREQNGGKVDFNSDVRDNALMKNFSSRQAWSILTENLADSDKTIIGDGLATRFDDAGIEANDIPLLEEYMLLKHSMDRDAQGKPVFDYGTFPTDEKEARIAEIEAQHPNIVAGLKAFEDFRTEFMQSWLVDTGFLTQESFDKMQEMYPNYVPTQRVMDNAGRGNRGGNKQTYQIRRATGGTQDIISPIDSFVDMVNSVVTMVNANKAAQAFDAAYQQYKGMGEFAIDVTQDMQKVSVDTTELQKKVSDLLSGEVSDDIFQEVLAAIGTEQSQWHGTGKVNLPNVLTVQRADGSKAFYRIYDPELYKLLASQRDNNAGPLFQQVAKLTKAMSALTTGSNPVFAVRNFMRDFQNSVNYGSWASNYLSGGAKWLRAAYDVWRNEGDYADYVALGGGGWNRIDTGTKKGSEDYRSALFKGYDTKDAAHTAKFVGKKIWNAITLARLNEIVEQTSRYAEYKFGQHDKSTAEGRQRAFLASQEATVDFARSGNSQLAANLKAIIPFLGASSQGVYRTGRMLTEAERGRAPARFTKTVVNTALASAICAALTLKFSSDDDKEAFANMSDDLKSQHFYLPNFFPEILGNQPLIRIPVAQDPLMYAIHGAVTNAIWNGSTDGLVIDLAATANTIVGNLNPVSSTVFDPLISMKTNINWYGSRIVPSRMDGWDPSTQYTEETPDAFVGLGRAIGVSPMKLQYLAEQYTGFLGQMLIPALSKDSNTGEIGGVKAAISAARKRLTSDPLVSNDIVGSFYDGSNLITEVSKAKDERPMNMLRRGLTSEEAGQAYAEAKNMLAKGGIIYETKAFIGECYSKIDHINANESLTEQQKYTLTSDVRREMIQAALDAQEEIGAFNEKYVTGKNIVTSMLYEGTYANLPTAYDNMDTAFKTEENAEYMQRAMSVYNSSGKDSALPHPAESFKYTPKGGKQQEYVIDQQDWNSYVEVYKRAYEKHVMDEKAWDDLDAEERYTVLTAAHRKGSDAAKAWYKKLHGIK